MPRTLPRSRGARRSGQPGRAGGGARPPKDPRSGRDRAARADRGSPGARGAPGGGGGGKCVQGDRSIRSTSLGRFGPWRERAPDGSRPLPRGPPVPAADRRAGLFLDRAVGGTPERPASPGRPGRPRPGTGARFRPRGGCPGAGGPARGPEPGRASGPAAAAPEPAGRPAARNRGALPAPRRG